MFVRILALFCVSVAFAADDDQQLALALKAQSDFDTVSLPAVPQLRDTGVCIQSQAALLPVASPLDVPLLHYRKGYCTLAEAAISHNPTAFQQAAAEFDAVIETWPGRAPKKSKVPPEPMPSAVRVLAAIARLEAAPMDDAAIDRARSAIAAAEIAPACPAAVMSAARCQEFLRIGREWLGWMAQRRGDLEEAARNFRDSSSTGWPAWIGARQAFGIGNYQAAARGYREAAAIWRTRKPGGGSMLSMIGPQPDLPGALADLGGAQLLAGDTAAALGTLDSAIRLDPDAARAYYLRARAREAAGQTEPAQADYSMASRRALAQSKDQASGEGHFYRAVLLYRRKQFAQAEDEFAGALNFDIPTALRADAAAWRHLAAVAAGSCAGERENLERSLASVSPYFPKDEARTAMATCVSSAAASAAK